MKRLAWFSAVALATATTVILLWEFRTAVLIFILSLALAATIRPMVDALARRGMSSGVALAAAYLVGIVAVVGLLLTLGRPLVDELQQITRDLSGTYGQIERSWPDGTPLQQALIQRLPSSADLYSALMGPQGRDLMQAFLGITIGSFDLLSQVVIVIVLSIYWTADQRRFKRLWLSLLPAGAREPARARWQALEAEVGAYIRSALAQSFLAIVILVPIYRLIGVPYAILLALAIAFVNLIPWLGFPLGIILAFGLSAGQALPISLGSAAVTLVVLAWLEFAVEPVFFHRERYSSLLVIVLALALSDLMGLTGLILAPALAVALQIMARPLRRQTMAATQIEINELFARTAKLHELVESMPDEPDPRLGSLLDRLDGLLDQAARETGQGAAQPAHAPQAAQDQPPAEAQSSWEKMSTV